VTTTPQAGLLSALDEAQAAYCLTECRVIFTQDKDFLRLHAARVPHAGIAYCHQQKLSIGDIIRRLTQIWEQMEPVEMRDWVVYL
jgi:hypothetical protein